MVDAELEEDVRHVLPKLLSVSDADEADVFNLASEADGKIALITSLVRLCQRT